MNFHLFSKIRNRSITKLGVMALVSLLAPTASSALVFQFADDFNRPNGPADNGWLDMVGSNPPGLAIINGRLSTSGTDGVAGIFRPVSYSGQTKVTATITPTNGYAGLRDRFGSAFTFGSGGGISQGLEVGFYRADENYNNSSVFLLENGSVIDTRISNFQFSKSITPTVFIDPGGRISGSVTGSNGARFDFDFGEQAPFLETDFGIKQSFADSRTGQPIEGTIDNLSFTSGLDAEKPRVVGLFIGVRDRGKTGFELRDDVGAQLLADSFRSLTGGSSIVLTGDRIYGEGIPISSIVDAINDIGSQLRPSDTLFIYLGSHGSSSLGGGFGDEQLVLSLDKNGSDFSDDYLRNILAPLDDVNKIIFLDACNSGGFWGEGSFDPYELFDNNDLDELKKITFISTASEFGYAYYRNDTGISEMTTGLTNIFNKYSGRGLSIDQMYSELMQYAADISYKGKLSYEASFGDEVQLQPGMIQPQLHVTSDFNGTLAAAVPEPQTYFLLSLGMGMCGAIFRRKANKINSLGRAARNLENRNKRWWRSHWKLQI